MPYIVMKIRHVFVAFCVVVYEEHDLQDQNDQNHQKVIENVLVLQVSSERTALNDLVNRLVQKPYQVLEEGSVDDKDENLGEEQFT